MNSVEPCMDMDADSDMQTRSCVCSEDSSSDVTSEDVVVKTPPEQTSQSTNNKRELTINYAQRSRLQILVR